MEATHSVSVPGGLWFDGVLFRDVELRPLPARDEVRLSDPDDLVGGRSAASRLTWLLSRCVVRFGPRRRVDRDLVRDLTVGDREALALHMRRLLFGERMGCVVSCPACHDLLDLELSVDQLLVPAYADARPAYEATVEGDGGHYRVRFRLPTGRDQEEAGAAALDDAAAVILRRCVLEVSGGDAPSASTTRDLPGAIADRLPALMAELDPQALLNLDMRCPSCEAAFVAPFTPSAFVVREILDRSKRLIAEVHALAMTYHWSEAAILALPRRRRHAYLDLLDRTQPVGSFG
jgi:hypothetical protein